MDEKEEASKKRLMWCFWISAAVVLFAFVIPVHVVSGEAVTRKYTLFDLLTGRGPSNHEVRVRETSQDPYPR